MLLPLRTSGASRPDAAGREGERGQSFVSLSVLDTNNSLITPTLASNRRKYLVVSWLRAAEKRMCGPQEFQASAEFIWNALLLHYMWVTDELGDSALKLSLN